MLITPKALSIAHGASRKSASSGETLKASGSMNLKRRGHDRLVARVLPRRYREHVPQSD